MKIFDPEGPLMTALAKLSDAVFCNIMFCLCSLPIFTIGAALAALYDCTMSIVEDTEKPSMFKQYWTSFRKNFKQATLLWLICLGVILILAAYSAAVGTLGGGLRKTYQVVFFLLAFLFLAALIPVMKMSSPETAAAIADGLNYSYLAGPLYDGNMLMAIFG